MMGTSRVEAFSDGVIAIIITIMVLELRAPHEATIAALRPLAPVLISYVLSFIYLGIYWSNHHHMLHVTQSVDGRVLWANLHLLFWLSLVPFVTAWMGETHFESLPVAAYGVVLLLAAISYTILQLAIVAGEGPRSVLASAIGSDLKGKVSILLYATAIPVAIFGLPLLAGLLYVVVAIIWLVPDRRIERAMVRHSE
jgi:uncharacterized membrane protein